jgi:hypothetical protein
MRQPSEIIPLAILQPSKSGCSAEDNQSVSAKVAKLENRLSCISPLLPRSSMSVSLAASDAAQLISASRMASGGLSLSKKRKSFKSPGKANLDQLLGLGSCENEASESEGEYFNFKRKCHSASTSTSRTTDRPTVHPIDCANPLICDLSAKVSGLSDSAEFNVNAVSVSRPRARAQTGSADIFSDNDEEEGRDGVLRVFTDETQRATRDNKNECYSNADIKTNAWSDMSSSVLTASAAVASESMVLVPRSRGRAAVTFSEFELSGVQHVELQLQSNFQEETERMDDALSNAELTGSYRRSSRLLRNSMNSSAKKNESRNSDRKSLGSSRAVSRESSQSGKPSMDVMRNDCGYGSYFSSMEFAAQVSYV